MIKGRKHEVLCVEPNFRGRYTHWFPLDEDAYDEKKEAATKDVGRKTLTPREKKLEGIFERIIDADFLTQKQKGTLTNYSDRQIRHFLKEREKDKEAGGGNHTKELTTVSGEVAP